MTREPTTPLDYDPQDRADTAETGPIEQVRQKVNGAISSAREKGEDVIADTREKAYRAAGETNRLFQEHPIAAVAAAAAAGAVIAIFLPKLAVASRTGAALSKASELASRAARSPQARQAAQFVATGIASAEKAAFRRAASETARLLGKRVMQGARKLRPRE